MNNLSFGEGVMVAQRVERPPLMLEVRSLGPTIIKPMKGEEKTVINEEETLEHEQAQKLYSQLGTSYIID